MRITEFAAKRYTAKSYDETRKVPQDIMDELRELLRLSPSSVNAQPWHFLVASSEAAKARIAKATNPNHSYNTPKILKASHVIVFCARHEMDGGHLSSILGQEERDGRFTQIDSKQHQHQGRLSYVRLHQYAQKDVQHWIEKQTYLALGSLLLGAAIKGIDATPMEGFDPQALDKEFALHEKGLTGIAIVSLGYHGAEDFNAGLPKSRLPTDYLFTDI